jgi:hypothetical protein
MDISYSRNQLLLSAFVVSLAFLLFPHHYSQAQDVPQDNPLLLAAFDQPCSAEKVAEVIAPADSTVSEVKINCDLILNNKDVVTKRLIFDGAEATGVRLNCSDATLDADSGIFDPWVRPMIEIKSRKFIDPTTGIVKWERPENITIENCNIKGKIHVYGMAKD